jgi:LysM repeat protein
MFSYTIYSNQLVRCWLMDLESNSCFQEEINPNPRVQRCPIGNTSYTIQRGDNLYILARRFGTTAASILAANRGLHPGSLYVGQSVCIPSFRAAAVCPRGSTTHTIQRGEHLYDLARRFGTTADAIIAANPRINPNALYIGQTICIPGRR